MANQQPGASPDEPAISPIALQIIIALVAAGGSLLYLLLTYGMIMIVADSIDDEPSDIVMFFPVTMFFAMLMAGLVVFVSVRATMGLSVLVIAVVVVMVATLGDDSASWSFLLFLLSPPVIVLGLSTWLARISGGTLRRGSESTRSIPLVGAAVIGSAFGVYQSIVMFNLMFMLCAAASVAILKWPRFAPWFAGFVVFVAALSLVESNDGPRVGPGFPLAWLVATAAMLPLVLVGKRALETGP